MTEQELRYYFAGRQMPNGPIALNGGILIPSPRQYVKDQLSNLALKDVHALLGVQAIENLEKLRDWLEATSQ